MRAPTEDPSSGVKEETIFPSQIFPRYFRSPPRRRRGRKGNFRRQEDAGRVLSARRGTIRESFEKVAIIKRAVPSGSL